MNADTDCQSVAVQFRFTHLVAIECYLNAKGFPVSMVFWLEHFGVAIAAITGVLAAKGKRIDLFGVIVVAIVTAVGGGSVRDVLLNTPVFWLNDPRYLATASITAVLWFFVARLRRFPRSMLLVGDAVALAFFTIVGARRALMLGCLPPIAVSMGVVTGVAGGVLRDVMLGEIPLVFRREIHLYATAAIVGASAYVAIVKWVPGTESYHMVLGTAITLLLRLAGLHWRIGLPVFLENEQRGDDEKLVTERYQERNP